MSVSGEQTTLGVGLFVHELDATRVERWGLDAWLSTTIA
jgi:hypothetical protein